MKKTIALIGSFDTKAEDYAFLRSEILKQGCDVFTINIGVLASTDLFPVNVEASEIAQAGGFALAGLRDKKDRGFALDIMVRGLAEVLPQYYAAGQFVGAIGMGGSGGTAVITAGLRALNLGVPKVCVSTMAAGDIKPYVDTKDIVMMPSVVDVAGLNRISKLIYAQAAGMIVGMVSNPLTPEKKRKPLIVASMFGNTTKCMNTCHQDLTTRGYEVIEFHMTGVGGKTMEQLVAEGFVDAVLDVTTTEWADAICDGVLAAYPERLSVPGRCGVPHLIAPGCIDMVNFGALSTVPEHYRKAGRLFYEWNPQVTLMRTNIEENQRLGRIFAETANRAKGPVAFLIPHRGYSLLGGEGELFYDRKADQAFVKTLRAYLDPAIPIIELDCNINDELFAHTAVEMLLSLKDKKRCVTPELTS